MRFVLIPSISAIALDVTECIIYARVLSLL